MSFFQSVPVPRPASFSGIYSEDEYVNNMVQRTANDYALAHARVQAFERQRDHHYHPHPHHHYHPHPHPHHHHHRQRRFGGPHRGCFAPASLDNFSYGFAPACTRPALYTPHRRPAAYSTEQLAYRVYQEEERRHALNRQLQAIARQQELAREREAQRQRALAEAAAREQQARAARAARIQARQAHDQEVLFALLSQLGLAVAPARSAPAPVIREQPSPSEQQTRAAHTARIQARQARGQELLYALLEQLGLTVGPDQSAPVAPQVNRPQPSVHITHNAAPIAVHWPFAPTPVPVDRKGKGKAVDVPAETPTLSPNPVPVPAKVPTLKEELEARIRSETDPEVRESLVLLYSDIFDARQPAQPVAGPSGHKHVSFEIPISGPSSSTTPSPVRVRTEEIDTTTVPILAEKPETDDTKTEEHHDAALHCTPALPPAIAAKLLNFYRARRARKLSLAQITEVEDALRKLEGAFEFPAHLDFVDRSPSPSPSPVSSESGTESALAYTANNTPIHVYEHALNDLLTRLDAVESNGDLEVRGRRKEVVKEVEWALEAMERRIEESRERSRERTRRGSVSSQVSDASVTVTPYNVHSSDNVDKVEVAVATEVVEEPKTTSEVEDTSPIVEDAPLQVEVSGPVPAATEETREVAPSPPSVDSVEPDYAHLAAGIPNSGADIYALSPSDQSIHGDPSSPIDDDEGLGRVLNVSSSSGDVSASHPPSAVDEATVPSTDDEHEVTMQAHVDAAGQDISSDGIVTAPTLESEAAVASPPEATEEANSISLSSFATPEAISRIQSSTTDTTFVTAEVDPVPLSAADDGTLFAAGIMTPSEAERSPTPPPVSAPTFNSELASSAGEETFLLSSTPLADEQPKKQRRLSTSESVGDDSDDLEIIGREELEAVRNDSDWSDVESESDADLEVVV